MRKHLKPVLFVLGATCLAPTSLAMSASECVQAQKTLSVQGAQLEKEYLQLKKLGDEADDVGAEFAAAKEESGLSDDAAMRARGLRDQFDDLREEVDQRNDDLMTRSAEFNSRQRTFHASCKAYIK